MRAILLFFILGTVTCMAQGSWKQTTDNAFLLEETGNWADALALRKKALNQAASLDRNTILYLRSLEKITQAELNLRIATDYENSYNLFKEGVKGLIASKSDAVQISKTYRRLGMLAHNYFRNMEDSYQYTIKSIEYNLKSKTTDTLILSKTLHSAGVISRELGKLNESLTHFNTLLTLYDRMSVKDTNTLGSTYRDLSLIYGSRFLNIPAQESYYLKKSNRTFASVKDPDLQYQVAVYTGLGRMELQNGDHNAAEGFFNKSIQLYRNNKAKTQSYRQGNIGYKLELQYCQNLLALYSASRNEQKLLNVLKTAESIKRRNDLDNIEHDIYTQCLNSVGLYFIEANPDRAILFFNNALASNKMQKELDFENEITTNVANALTFKNEYGKALALINSVDTSKQMSALLENRSREVRIKSLFGLKQPRLAILHLTRLVARMSADSTYNIQKDALSKFKPGFAISDASSFVNISEAISGNSREEKLLKEKLYWLALLQFEKNIGNLPATNALKDDYSKIIGGILEAGTQRRFSAYENNVLLSAMENIEARFLLNKLLLKRSLSSNQKVNSYLEKEQFLRSNITFLTKKYYESKDESIKQKIFEEQQSLKELESNFIARNPAYAGLLTKKYTFTDFKLPKDQVYLKFKAIGNTLYKIELSQDKVSYSKISDYENLKKQIAGYLTKITDVSSDVTSIKRQGNHIYRRLFREGTIAENKIVVIPDDILYYLPFELLVDTDYLLKKYTFAYSVGWSYLDPTVIKKSRHADNIAFFAPSYKSSNSPAVPQNQAVALGGARREVHEISQMITGRTYLGDLALKSNFRECAKDVAVLHLSMHSYLNDENPELSSLAFASKEKDSQLYISELYGYTFNSDLAVLSACNTGVGGFKDGGSLISMSHAFTFAGIPSTVSSLWSAPDQSTRKLMVSFYQHLRDGQSKSEAIKNAKLDYLKSTRNIDLQHPFYWAGFVMYGNDSPIDFITPNTSRYVIMGLAVLAMLGGYYCVWRSKRKVKQIR